LPLLLQCCERFFAMGDAVSWCSSIVLEGLKEDSRVLAASPLSESLLVLRVFCAPVEGSPGARPSGFKHGNELCVTRLGTPPWLDVLAWRYREKMRARWPQSYRFQTFKRAWHALVLSKGGADGKGAPQSCVFQLAARSEHRTRANVDLDLEDAKTAASYAHRFNLFMQQHHGGEAGDALPIVKVAAPVGCEVIASSYPAMIPMGTHCTLTAYPAAELRKFVFAGDEAFMELPQAYFHYVAFASSGKQLVCDIQGSHEDDGHMLFVDPCVWQADPRGVSDLVAAVMPQNEHSNSQDMETRAQTSAAYFDAVHPKCPQLCKAFDPIRGSSKLAAGTCNMGVTCDLGRHCA